MLTLRGPRGRKVVDGLIDTGAEGNILPEHIARELGCVNTAIDAITMSTATNQDVSFAAMAKVRTEIVEGVGCDTSFFLVNDPARRSSSGSHSFLQ